jgi:hypothetical protein
MMGADAPPLLSSAMVPSRSMFSGSETAPMQLDPPGHAANTQRDGAPARAFLDGFVPHA